MMISEWDVFLVYGRIGSSAQHGLNGKLQLGDSLTPEIAARSAKQEVFDAKNIISSLLFCTNRFIEVTQYQSSNYFDCQ